MNSDAAHSKATPDPVITCPKCGAQVRLTESLAAPMMEVMRKQFEKRLEDKEREMSEREGKLREKSQEIAIREGAIDEKIASQVAERLDAERKKLADKEAERARAAVADEMEERRREMAEMSELLKSRTDKLEEAQKAQAELLKMQRALEDQKREMDLTVQKGILDGLGEVQQKARKDAEEALSLKISESEQTIQSLQKTIDELKRKADQGSQQLQGEVQELQLEERLKQKFVYDRIAPVPKGERGADVLQHVINNGQDCGVILWESKRTKSWSGAWLAKLRTDQRAAKAEIAVIETQAMPPGIEGFGFLDGIWVTSPKSAEPVAYVLRHTLIEVSNARLATEGVKTKTELLYQYLTGPHFRQRVEAIVEAFSVMKEDLDKERKAIMKQWSKREQQIEKVMQATVGMYGDLQGIAGQSLQEIDGMSLMALEE
ncbi:MAG: DUF2130 domain-containing protein [Synergistaceae bacterium]|jgi:hypothetical protein|nr:DUF2130 domain-containing protein [Synergistaceae bacterium]